MYIYSIHVYILPCAQIVFNVQPAAVVLFVNICVVVIFLHCDCDTIQYTVRYRTHTATSVRACMKIIKQVPVTNVLFWCLCGFHGVHIQSRVIGFLPEVGCYQIGKELRVEHETIALTCKCHRCRWVTGYCTTRVQIARESPQSELPVVAKTFLGQYT